MFRASLLLVLALTLSLTLSAQPQNPREKKVRDDKKKVEADGFWIYNDLPKAFDEAKKTGKPIIVVLRCLPCEECVKLDDDLVDKNPIIRPLLDKYVRVRVVSTNGLDLSLFQYDYDQSFACFLLNADGTIYGRFGTRSHRTEWLGDVSIDGLTKALQAGLELHAQANGGRRPSGDLIKALAGKRGPAPEVPVPEAFPTLKGKYGPKLNYEGNVVQSCIHCHQIADSQKSHYRAKGEPLPPHILFPYPHPKSQGLILDPKEKATVLKVTPGSSAERAGFRAGDAIQTLEGQPLISMADVQWVLHQTSDNGGTVNAAVLRDGKPVSLSWTLRKGWRQADDISWRSSTWGLRRMGTGGMLLESLPADERPAGVPKDGMALRAKHVGQFGAHAAAKNAGFLAGDVIVAFDGKTDLLRETDLLAYALTAHKPGDKVAVKLVRNGKVIEKMLPMQE